MMSHLRARPALALALIVCVGQPSAVAVAHGVKRDRLLGAASPMARSVELRAAAAKPGQRANGAPAAFELPPGGALQLVVGGPHIVLVGVEKALVAYDTFKFTLVFEKAGRIEVEVLVEEAAVSGQSHD